MTMIGDELRVTAIGTPSADHVTIVATDQAGAPASVLLALLTRELRDERRGDHLYLTWPANRQG